jgi:hypothetical protein
MNDTQPIRLRTSASQSAQRLYAPRSRGPYSRACRERKSLPTADVRMCPLWWPALADPLHESRRGVSIAVVPPCTTTPQILVPNVLLPFGNNDLLPEIMHNDQTHASNGLPLAMPPSRIEMDPKNWTGRSVKSSVDFRRPFGRLPAQSTPYPGCVGPAQCVGAECCRN